MVDSVQVSINLIYLLSLGILCVISLLLAIYYDQKQILKQRKDPASEAPKPKPAVRTIATRSGRVLVTGEKRKVIYNDDDRIWLMEQMDKEERKGDYGSE